MRDRQKTILRNSREQVPRPGRTLQSYMRGDMAHSRASGGDAAQPQSLAFGCAVLVVAMLTAAASVFIYAWLRDWHRPVTLTMSTHDLTDLQELSLTSPSQPVVRWSLSGSVARLTVAGVDAGTAAVVILPLADSACQKMASQLDATCADGQVLMSSQAEITWSSAQTVDTVPEQQAAASFEVIPVPPPGSGTELTLFTQMKTYPTLCFPPPTQPVMLNVLHGGHNFPLLVPGYQPVTCGSGLRLVIGSAGRLSPPFLEFARISSMTVRAWAPVATADGFTGPITLSPGGTTIVSVPADVSMRGDSNAALAATVSLGALGPPVQVQSGGATSVVTSAGELVPSEWARDPGIAGPLLGAFVTAFVVSPFGVSVQVFMGLISRSPAWLRRRWPPMRRRLQRLQLRLWRMRQRLSQLAQAGARPPRKGSP